MYKLFTELVQLTVEGDQSGKTLELIKTIKESSVEIDTLIDSLSSNLPKNMPLETIVNFHGIAHSFLMYFCEFVVQFDKEFTGTS